MSIHLERVNWTIQQYTEAVSRLDYTEIKKKGTEIEHILWTLRPEYPPNSEAGRIVGEALEIAGILKCSFAGNALRLGGVYPFEPTDEVRKEIYVDKISQLNSRIKKLGGGPVSKPSIIDQIRSGCDRSLLKDCFFRRWNTMVDTGINDQALFADLCSLKDMFLKELNRDTWKLGSLESIALEFDYLFKQSDAGEPLFVRHKTTTATPHTKNDILELIGENEGCTSSEIAESLNLSKSVVSEHTKTLKKDGEIVEKEDPNDKRKKLLFLKKKG